MIPLLLIAFTLNHRPLFDAIRQEESKDGVEPFGDGGRSLGDYHISRAYWTDGCEFGNLNWPYDSLVWSRWHSEQVMLCYWSRYGAKTDEQKARMHNGGGPKGMRKASTLRYWRRIRKGL